MRTKRFCLYLLIGLISTLMGCQDPTQKRVSNPPETSPVQPLPKTYRFDNNRGCYLEGMVNGYTATQDNPLKNHVVMILSKFKKDGDTPSTLCTGTLIGPKTVLTAAHCFPKNLISVNVVASINLFCSSGFNQHLVYPTSRVVVHPNYKHKDSPSGNSPDYDVAVVDFEGILPQEYSPLTLQKIDVQTEMKNPQSHMIMIGYGRTQTNVDSMPELRYITKNWDNLILFKDSVNLVDRLSLVSVYQADAKGGCSGDSGGPLLIEDNGIYKILGVASYIESASETRLCEQGQIFYSYVTSYWDWITEQMP